MDINKSFNAEKINKLKVSELHENQVAQILIKAHTIGGLRSAADLDNCKFHCYTTLNIFKEMLLDIDGTNEEKAEFINKVIEDLKQFIVK